MPMPRPATALVLLVAALASACSTPQQDKVGAAVASPVSDLNLVHAPIPEPLQAALRAPYALPVGLAATPSPAAASAAAAAGAGAVAVAVAPEAACKALAAEIRTLDEVLGQDIDLPPGAGPSLLERGGDLVVDALRRSAEGLVPFRSWVRKLTGAERYAREVAAAITAGSIRRGFLKGLARAYTCPG
jgi:hypothetical protein